MPPEGRTAENDPVSTAGAVLDRLSGSIVLLGRDVPPMEALYALARPLLGAAVGSRPKRPPAAAIGGDEGLAETGKMLRGLAGSGLPGGPARRTGLACV